MSTVQVLVATAEREVYRGEAEMLVAPGAAGELGILPKHAPLLSQLKPGELRITNGENVDEVFISGGFIEVQPDMITVLADSAERASDMDEAAALAAQRKAEEVLESQKGDADLALAEAELSIMAARLDWLRKKRKN
ncbi:MAG: F0F1 ATP synthase subunit epsilon [Zetaproteobacteria bacterium CG12_big_fil_rev_8_21_14_0_65_55_1124]|nr:MAG: F0F1 ATP synthase subunit epsilon [Zetaproteobacteria bacterium CG1_02_55_237]PIS18844.1 MAG: F0F1 ATP synthase subunit epsilon [Zetaproteobacteria bacterium CG08_land_8_20_14_0_20_55_17]PIW42762.1 MAG: F0F1 ATP synthase subunit epsilon [Zetaproteobacteria bacterium CG12_big_fil_rev_8_21_14_0_65_55_1124]PIY51789.1 MAG: F0F1 ATP synthase subunit epsilon [Zetaproteobacteria bacterium CG_4_10_14_0_8_um_filter_55_43]PIZ40041.1 MAG: F0F1 ATP synthase subunit epsilon [Zetaproteobacteria bacte